MDMMARKINLGKFRNGKSRILIVTDIAARGLDIPLLDNVINYDFPPTSKVFVHRVGRCGRQERIGNAYTIVTNSDIPYVADLGLYLQRDYFNTPNKPLTVKEMTHDTAYVGRLPRSLIIEEIDKINSIKRIKEDDIEPLQKSLENSYMMYNKTREEPSARSIKRFKEIEEIPIHPLFINRCSEDDIQLDQVKKLLSTYRPPETIMEFEKLKNGKGVDEVMIKKRKIHETAIIDTKNKKQKKEFKDDDNNNDNDDIIDNIDNIDNNKEEENKKEENEKVHFNISEKKKIKKLIKQGKTKEEAEEIILANKQNKKEKENKTVLNYYIIGL